MKSILSRQFYITGKFQLIEEGYFGFKEIINVKLEVYKDYLKLYANENQNESANQNQQRVIVYAKWCDVLGVKMESATTEEEACRIVLYFCLPTNVKQEEGILVERKLQVIQLAYEDRKNVVHVGDATRWKKRENTNANADVETDADDKMKYYYTVEEFVLLLKYKIQENMEEIQKPEHQQHQRNNENVRTQKQDKNKIVVDSTIDKQDETFLFPLPEKIKLFQPRTRKYLLVVNPVGGKGNAVDICKNVVEKVLKYAEIEYETVVTDYNKHAIDMAVKILIESYDTIVCVGGDGLATEIIQGLMKRKDWRVAIRMPIALIPGGSGNGFAKSIAEASREAFAPLNLAFIAVKGSLHPMDIATTRYDHGIFYSVLGISWGLIANIDVLSEDMRWLGELRFTVQSFSEIYYNRKYKGTLWYLKDDIKEDAIKYNESDEDNDNRDQRPTTRYLPIQSDNFEKELEGSSKWGCVEGDFTLFWSLNVPYGSSSTLAIPQAVIGDGYMHIIYSTDDVNRIEAASILLGMSDGSHTQRKSVKMLRTKSYILQTSNKNDIVTVDGERISTSSVKVELHPGLGNTLMLHGNRHSS